MGRVAPHTPELDLRGRKGRRECRGRERGKKEGSEGREWRVEGREITHRQRVTELWGTKLYFDLVGVEGDGQN